MPPGGIQTHNLSRQVAKDLRLRPRGNWDQHLQSLLFWNKEELLRKRKESIILPIHVKGGETDCSVNLLYTKLLGVMTVDFNVVDCLLTRSSISITYN